MKTLFVNYGIASKHKNHIEVNRNLKRYPPLLKQVLKHERMHTNRLDLWLDIKNMLNLKKQFSLFMFTLRHPSAITELLPIFKDYNNQLVCNPALAAFYTILLMGVVI